MDITTGLVVQADITYTNGGSAETFPLPVSQGSLSQSPFVDSNLAPYRVSVSNSLGDSLNFALSVPSLTLLGTGMGNVCSLQGTICPVIDPDGGQADLTSAYGSHLYNSSPGDWLETGTFVFDASVIVGQTPEVSSFILLGTGAIGIAGVVRRRFTA